MSICYLCWHEDGAHASGCSILKYSTKEETPMTEPLKRTFKIKPMSVDWPRTPSDRIYIGRDHGGEGSGEYYGFDKWDVEMVFTEKANPNPLKVGDKVKYQYIFQSGKKGKLGDTVYTITQITNNYAALKYRDPAGGWNKIEAGTLLEYLIPYTETFVPGWYRRKSGTAGSAMLNLFNESKWPDLYVREDWVRVNLVDVEDD